MAMTRLLISLLVSLTFGLLVIPLAAGTPKPGKVYRLGLFHVGLDHVPPSLDSLREELHTLGYAEGTNLVLDWRNLPDEATAGETAQAFVRQHVDLIVAFENQTARAAKAATTEIPIVFAHVTDPVADGLVDNLARPGRNLTGFVSASVELTTKRLELFHECVPSLRRILVLTDPHDPTTPRLLAQARTASATLHVVLVEHAVTEPAEIERVFGALTPGEVDGVFVVSPNLHVKFSALFIRLAAEKHLPLPVHRKEWVVHGGLFSYGYDLRPVGRGVAHYVDKILQGAKAADLPVEWMDHPELVINLNTAQALGITIPSLFLFQADEVIGEVHQEGGSAPGTHPHHQK
jgi:ABC-type uncharacterized transport system substrate-binding protein